MTEHTLHPVPPAFTAKAWVDAAKYEAMYARSLKDPEGFWAEQAGLYLTWTKRWARVRDCDYREPRIKWFEGGRLNAAANCIDRHLPKRADQVAILWEGDDAKEQRKVTYKELHEAVCRLA